MTSRAKQVGLLLLAQTGCLAVGLWMQHRYVVSASLQPLDAQAWAEIEAAAETLFSELSLAVRGTKRSTHDLLAQTALWLADHGPVTGEGLVVDGHLGARCGDHKAWGGVRRPTDRRALRGVTVAVLTRRQLVLWQRKLVERFPNHTWDKPTLEPAQQDIEDWWESQRTAVRARPALAFLTNQELKVMVGLFLREKAERELL